MPMAIPLLAAAGTISAGIAATGIIGGMMIAGGALTIMGTLTKDKSLTKWGGLLSLAGGVAGLATGAWQSAAEGVAGEVSGMDLAADAAAGSGNAVGGAGDAVVSGMDMAADAAGPMTAPVSPGGGGMLSTDLASAPALDTASPVAAAPAAPAAPAGPAAPTPQAVTQPTAPNVVQKVAPVAADTTGGALQPAVDWAKANPRLVQAGTGLLSAGLQYYGAQDAAKESIRLREEADQRARTRLNTSVQGVRVPTYQRKA